MIFFEEEVAVAAWNVKYYFGLLMFFQGSELLKC